MTQPAHIIVLGNEKGGSGKSTTAVHLAVALAHQGRTVGAIDLDGRQRTLYRYLENRQRTNSKLEAALACPEALVLMDKSPDEDAARLNQQLDDWQASKDVIVIDCPGRDSSLSRAAHNRADTLITPMNDSFIDFDLLGTVDDSGQKVVRPSFYSEMVWRARQARAARSGSTMDWIVLRTRLSQLEARNMRKVGSALDQLARRIGFRIAPGLSERVIFRELFPSGLTLLDLGQEHDWSEADGSDAIAPAKGLTMSQLAARQELRDLVSQVRIGAPQRPGVYLTGQAAQG